MYDVRMSKTHAALVLSALILIGSTSYTISGWGAGSQRTPQVVAQGAVPARVMMPAEDLMVVMTALPSQQTHTTPAATTTVPVVGVGEREEQEDD